ncbi:MAG: sodium:solute symporter [Saprospiraceae bacterium]|nr:sodium:solute symporter [Saprospiraceae bacterium]
MAVLDWAILLGTLLFIVIYGYWKTRGVETSHSYFKGDENTKWWTVGLSVMATQASAITFMSTPGQAFFDGMGFVQIYFGLPIAMVIICITFIPLFHKLKVYTAYEFLEKRFDLKTRLLTAILFLIQRGLAAGITIYAPAIILSTILGWNLNLLNILLGLLVILYTVSGGSKAVNITQKQQMFIIIGGMFFVFFYTLHHISPGLRFNEVIQMASAAGKTDIIDFSFDIENRYTIWSGIAGGFFLSLSYFGTDQSQVQRYLSGNSIQQSRLGLIFNGLLKVPMQFFILLTGVIVFVFFQFNQAPIFFNSGVTQKMENSVNAKEWDKLNNTNDSLYLLKNSIIQNTKQDKQKHYTQLEKIWEQEKELKKKSTDLISGTLPEEETNDKDYVFIYYILNYLPNGLIGLLLAVIFSAAMSSTSAELNALAPTTTVDIYKRNIIKNGDDKHYLTMSKLFTVIWGVLAILFACWGTLFENLIQLVNIVGSIFYGTILGIFIIAFYIRRFQGSEVFAGAVTAQIMVLSIYFTTEIGYLWLNAIGCFAVIIISTLYRIFQRFSLRLI